MGRKIWGPRKAINEDPFKFLNVAKPQNLVHAQNTHYLARSRKQLLAIGVCILATLLVLLGTAITRITTNWTNSEKSYAYFEIKAIDEGGRPIAGAQVFQGTQEIGVTDSFGEWRRYMEAKLGEEIEFIFVKNFNLTKSQASKKILVPRSKPSKGDLEIYSSVSLKKEENTSLSTPSSTPTQTKVDLLAHQAKTSDLKIRNTLVTFENAKDDSSRSLQENMSSEFILNHINKMVHERRTEFLHTCETLHMNYIPHDKNEAFVEIICKASGNYVWSTLRNVETSKKITAEKTFQAMIATAKTQALHKAPHSNWVPLKLALNGFLPKEAKVYISGYMATKSSDGYFTYFGQPHGHANLTIVHRNAVLHRQRLVNNESAPRYIHLPKKSLARASRSPINTSN